MDLELRFYRAAIWLPLLLPASIWGGVSLFGMPRWDALGVVTGILLVSLFYGGIPYAGLAVWATWRSRRADVAAMRRLAWRAPLLMLLVFLPFALGLGALDGELWGAGLGLFGLGALYILPLGYLYVVLTVAVGRLLGARRITSHVAPAV